MVMRPDPKGRWGKVDRKAIAENRKTKEAAEAAAEQKSLAYSGTEVDKQTREQGQAAASEAFRQFDNEGSGELELVPDDVSDILEDLGERVPESGYATKEEIADLANFGANEYRKNIDKLHDIIDRVNDAGLSLDIANDLSSVFPESDPDFEMFDAFREVVNDLAKEVQVASGEAAEMVIVSQIAELAEQMDKLHDKGYDTEDYSLSSDEKQIMDRMEDARERAQWRESHS